MMARTNRYHLLPALVIVIVAMVKMRRARKYFDLPWYLPIPKNYLPERLENAIIVAPDKTNVTDSFLGVPQSLFTQRASSIRREETKWLSKKHGNPKKTANRQCESHDVYLGSGGIGNCRNCNCCVTLLACKKHGLTRRFC